MSVIDGLLNRPGGHTLEARGAQAGAKGARGVWGQGPGKHRRDRDDHKRSQTHYRGTQTDCDVSVSWAKFCTYLLSQTFSTFINWGTFISSFSSAAYIQHSHSPYCLCDEPSFQGHFECSLQQDKEMKCLFKRLQQNIFSSVWMCLLSLFQPVVTKMFRQVKMSEKAVNFFYVKPTMAVLWGQIFLSTYFWSELQLFHWLAMQ